MTRKQANALLSVKPTIAKINPSSLVVMVIAEPKWGKTKFFMSNPNAVLLAFETGHRFQLGNKIEIDKWHEKNYDIEKDSEGVPHMTMTQAMDVLDATDRYDFVIMDTVDMAAKMCVDYHCEKLGVEHPSDAGDYGKGWDVTINTPMRRAILRILKSGRGVGLITHTKVAIERFTSGERARKESTLPSGVRKFCETQADVIMHGEFGRKRPGLRMRDRVLVCEGDMDTLAGNRSGAMLPERYIVSPTDPWAQFVKFFKDPKAGAAAELEYKKLSKKQK